MGAEGTYLPMYNAADGSYSTNGGRDNAFVLVPNVQLYGGFDPDGGITDIDDDRILPTAMTGSGGTILSGDLDSNDNDDNFDNHTNNAYHVLILPSGLDEAAVNGVTIKGGNADGSSTVTVLADGFEQNSGGGVTSQSSITVEQSVVNRNKASSLGGGVYHYLASDAVCQNIVISENESQFGGCRLAITDTTSPHSISVLSVPVETLVPKHLS